MTKKRIYIIKYLTLTAIGVLTVGFFHTSPSPKCRILNIQNCLITVSGIISGIVIAYLATKLFNIKRERERRQLEIDRLSEKLTNYRRILYCVIRSREFWNRWGNIFKFQQQFQGLDWAILHGEKAHELKTKYYE